MEEKPKRGRPKKVETAAVEETAIVPVEENVEPAPKPKRTRKSQTPKLQFPQMFRLNLNAAK